MNEQRSSLWQLEKRKVRSPARLHFVRLLLAFLGLLLLPFARGQNSPILYAETIIVTTGGPLEFTFRDDGTGATNYIAEFSAALGNGAAWSADPAATITPLATAHSGSMSPIPSCRMDFTASSPCGLQAERSSPISQPLNFR